MWIEWFLSSKLLFASSAVHHRSLKGFFEDDTVKHTLEMKNIVKRFPGVLANDHVSLTIQAGEIHALVGENGAGKSTLMQILYGFHSMDSGEIFIDGQPIHLNSPKDAITLGIGMVHQEFMLVPTFSVVENIVLGLSEGVGPMLDLPRAASRTRDLSDRYGLALDPSAKVGALPIGVQQRVEILKLLYRDASLLILDEPTSVLTPGEKDRLFAVLKELSQSGHSIVIVTHKLNEIMELADRVTVMRDGRALGTKSVRSTSQHELAQLMIGRDVHLHAVKLGSHFGEPILRVEELCVADDADVEKVHGLSLEVRAGEIFGIAGVDGNGQSELAEAILHLRKMRSGRIFLNGTDVTEMNVAERRAKGISYVPADRRQVGSVTEMSLADNAVLGLQRRYTRGPFRSVRDVRHSANRLAERFGIRGAGIDSLAGKLSGGNLQKLILGREITCGASLLVVEQPTRGLDVGAVESVWKELLRARQQGKAVLLISTEMEELLNLADRMAVLFGGRIVGVFDAPFGSVDQIGLLMAGIAPPGLSTRRPSQKTERDETL
jgi:general nucleoside transport system ATP-binding protein